MKTTLRAALRAAAIAAAGGPLLALLACPPASAVESLPRSAAAVHDGCATDSMPQSCISITYAGTHVQSVRLGVGEHVRGGPYRGQYDVWDSAKVIELHTGPVTFAQNQSYIHGHTEWGPSYDNFGAGWHVPRGDKICAQITQPNGDVSTPVCVTTS